MSQVVVAVVWLVLVASAALASAGIERRARLEPRPDRPELAPRRAEWGGDPLPTPAHSPLARALADFARSVRSRSVVAERRAGLRYAARGGVVLSLASALALIPFAGSWGGRAEAPPLVALDMRHGLPAVALLLLLASFSRVALGLADRNVWSRLASVQQTRSVLVGFALFLLVAAPLALVTGSLRLQDVALAQAQTVAPLAGLLANVEAEWASRLGGLRLPAWNLWLQPITALLFVPAMALLPSGSRAGSPGNGPVGVAGFDFDATPLDLYWSRLEARASRLFASALFVVLFLGAGSIPYVDPASLVAGLERYGGEVVPRLLVAGLLAGVFFVQWLLVLSVGARLGRLRVRPRADRTIELATRRWLPLAWANLLLVAALTLRADATSRGLG